VGIILQLQRHAVPRALQELHKESARRHKRLVRRQRLLKNQFAPRLDFVFRSTWHEGHPVPLLRLEITARHRWDFAHFHQTFLCEKMATLKGVSGRFFLRHHSLTSPGFEAPKLLSDRIFFPPQYGQEPVQIRSAFKPFPVLYPMTCAKPSDITPRLTSGGYQDFHVSRRLVKPMLARKQVPSPPFGQHRGPIAPVLISKMVPPRVLPFCRYQTDSLMIITSSGTSSSLMRDTSP